MSNQTREVGLGEALARGFGLAWRAPGVVGLALLAEVSAQLLGIALQLLAATLAVRAFAPLLAAAPLGYVGSAKRAGAVLDGNALPALLGTGVVVGLLVLAVRLLWVSAGTRFFGMRLCGEQVRFGLGFAAERFARAAQVGLAFVPVWLSGLLFGATVIGAGWLVWGRALASGRGGASGAALLAFGLVLALFVNKAIDLLLRLWLVRAVAADEGPLGAFAGAWRLLVERAGSLVALLVVFGLLGSFAGVAAGAGGLSLAAGGKAGAALGIAFELLGGLVGGALLAFLATAELGAVTAIDAGARGALPPPPVPAVLPEPPPVESEPILATEVVLATEPR